MELVKAIEEEFKILNSDVTFLKTKGFKVALFLTVRFTY